MDIQATCGCGAKVSITPGSPSSLGNSHGYASNNTATVDAEREAVERAFKEWIQTHAECGRPVPPPIKIHLGEREPLHIPE